MGTVAATLAFAAADELAWNAKALQLHRAGHYADAEAMYRRAIEAFLYASSPPTCCEQEATRRKIDARRTTSA